MRLGFAARLMKSWQRSKQRTPIDSWHSDFADGAPKGRAERIGIRDWLVGSEGCGDSFQLRGLNLDEPSVLPILEAAAAMDVAICVHPTIVEQGGRFPRYHFWNSFGASLKFSLAAMSVIYSGLLDRYPDTRILFTQGGGWIQFGVGRLDLRYQQHANARPMASPPADYLARMYFDCLVHDLDSLDLLVRRAGASMS